MQANLTNAPIHAPVDCVDGPGGESLGLVVNPLTRKVTHLVIRAKDPGGAPSRLVPVEQVAGVAEGRIFMRCSRGELAGFEPFTERSYHLTSHADYHMAPIDPTGMLLGSVPMESYYVTAAVERIPADELKVSAETRVCTGDGEAGHVAELVVDPVTREVTHFVLLRRDREITLPLSAIDYIAEDVVYLKLDQTALDMLPSVPAPPRHGPWAGTEVELVGAVFDGTDTARQTLDFVTNLQHRGILQIRNAAVLAKEPDGRIVVKERGDLNARGGALAGAVLGGVIGLVTGGAGLVAAPVAGAVLGGVGGKAVDRGFSDTFLKVFAEHLQPGMSALLLIVQHDWVAPLRAALADQKGVILQQTLTDRIIAELTGGSIGRS